MSDVAITVTQAGAQLVTITPPAPPAAVNVQPMAAYVGPKGDPGGVEVIPFAYGDATPVVLPPVPANKACVSVSIVITKPFDGEGAKLAVMTADSETVLMPDDGNDPTSVGEYAATPVAVFSTDTQISLFITPGIGASMGAGFLQLEVQP